MGKGNRAKKERASSVLAGGASKKTAKKSLPTWVGTSILCGVLAFLIVFASVAVMSSRGVFVRGKIVAATKNYEISVPMMSYMVYTQYQNWTSTYEGYYQYITGTGGDKLNTNKSLHLQNYSVTKDETTGATTVVTWFDFFASSAKTQAEQVLIFCECANAMGMELDADDYKEIDGAINLLKAYAAIYGYTTDAYISMQYGKGVNIKDVRKMMELSQLASKYSEYKMEQLEEGATDKRVEEFYNKNQKDYDVSINFIGYEFEATFTPAADTDAEKDSKNAAALEKYQAEQKKYKERVEALKACESVEAFNELLYSYFRADAVEAGAENPDAEALKKMTEATKENYEKPSTPSDADSWLFSTPSADDDKDDDAEDKDAETTTGRKVGDTNSFVTEKKAYENEKYSKATSTYSAYIVTKELHRNDTKVRDVGHILLKTSTYKNLTNTGSLPTELAKLAEKFIKGEMKDEKGEKLALNAENMAKAVLDVMMADKAIEEKTNEDGEKYYVIDKDKFEEYGKKYNEDSNIFYEEVAKGDMVAPFENWLFDSARVDNEISYPAAVESEYGFHIMFFTGECDEESWFVDCRTDLIDDDYKVWYEGQQKAFGIQWNNDNMMKIDA
ncbi:MAG: hypothetical protein IJY16_00205 [Clostridia bacterium]|nr:hypothetical protein [Clostridia bacterium]